MSFYSPQTSSINSDVVQLKAFNSTDIAVRYRDTSGSNSTTHTVTANKLKLDLSSGFDEQILTGSSRFKVGADTFIDRDGLLYRAVNPSNGSGIQSGLIQYGTGKVEIDSWTPSANNTISLESLTTSTDMLPVNKLSFRTPIIPIRPQSMTILITSLEFGALVLTPDENGIIETSRAHGQVDYETGFVSIYFYVKTVVTQSNRADLESEDWYDPLLEYSDNGSTYIDVPVWIDASAARYSAVAYTYIPLDPDILGLSATRLPIDGRVPIFRVGGIGIVSASKSYELQSHVAGTIHEFDDQRISWCELIDSDGTKVDSTLYTVDFDYGKLTLSGDFALVNLVLPLTAKYRYQDMGLIRDVQINGQITFTKPLTHNYDADYTIVGSALIVGDVFARYTGKFVQGSWSNVWSDAPSGAAISANYNDALYPFKISNKGAIQERWYVQFTGAQSFRCVGEYSGEIDTGTTTADFSPINPVTNAPYFTIKKEGWGSGWANGNVMRFDTVAANFPVWVIRTVKQSERAVMSDAFQIMWRGDIDRKI